MSGRIDEADGIVRARRNVLRHRERLERMHSQLCVRASEDYRVSMMRECPERLAKHLIRTAERRQDRASMIRDLFRAIWCVEGELSLQRS